MRYTIPVTDTDDSTEIAWIIDPIEDEYELVFFDFWLYLRFHLDEQYPRVIARECRDTSELSL